MPIHHARSSNRFRSTHRPTLNPLTLIAATATVSRVLFSCTTETVRSNTWESAASMRYSNVAPTFRGNPGAANIGNGAGSANAGAKGPDRRFVNTWSSHEGAPRITRRAWLSQTNASR